MHAESYQADEHPADIEVPAALLAALQPKNGVQPQDLHVESFRPSLFGRLAQLFVQKRR
jgi:hypothetical protein